MFHKPAGVVCATSDSNLGNIVRNKNDARYGLKKDVEARPTVYDIAQTAGYPTDFGLVGRLDTETSGIMLFTSNSDLLRKLKDPPITETEYITLYPSSDVPYSDYCKSKSKRYELLMLSGKRIATQLAASGGYFDCSEFEALFSQPFTFHRNGEECQVGASTVRLIKRYQDPNYSHDKPELG